MKDRQRRVNHLLTGLLSFVFRVLRGFMRNQCLLLSGALAYYILLSIVPMSILALTGLSHFVGKEQLANTFATYTGMLIPGYREILAEQIQVFLGHRQAVGIIGFLAMLFFSSLAFGVLQSALSVIFSHRIRISSRNFLISAFIPYLYVLAIGLGIGLVSFITGALEILEQKELILFSVRGMAVNVLRVVSEVILLSSMYLLMPAVRTTLRHALIGGVTATVLWEITRHVLVWYYATLSMVNLIYGSFATAVVALLTTEAASLILLLGAQVIAELEHKTNEFTGDIPVRQG